MGYDQNMEGKMALRKGSWTSEEDAILIDSITLHGEGRWNSLACLAGLNRTGRSCRLRWLNYLRPNLRRGNLTIQEQLLILELHSRFGNRWSRIAEHLPGRTDNEIKNYWRTRVQKQARLLNCDANSHYFRYALLPRLMEQLTGHVQSSNSSCWTHQGMSPTFTGNYDESRQIQGSPTYTHVPRAAWNDPCRETHVSNKCPVTEGLCSPFLRGTSFVELDNQAFVQTEPVSPDIYLTGENFWLLPVEQTLESLISS